MTLKDKITNTLRYALHEIGELPDSLPIKLEYARDEKFGDYACTVAMDKRFRDHYEKFDAAFKNPKRFAEEIRNRLINGPDASLFDSVEIANPAFINITLSEEILLNFAKQAAERRSEYGHTKKENPLNIIFEFVSANPTGPLNVVSARAAALGDSCCNLLEAAGDKVHREYYVNDYGNQVNLLGTSSLLRHLESKGAKLKFSSKEEDGSTVYKKGSGIPFPSEGYHGEYLKDVVLHILKDKNSSLYPALTLSNDLLTTLASRSLSEDIPEDWLESDVRLSELATLFGNEATRYFLETHKEDLKKFRVHFTNFYSERSLHENDSVLNVRKDIQKHLFINEGKEFFRSTDYGDDKDRVVVREDKRPTYLLADIAYHKTKIVRKFDRIYNIWGPDHHGYVKRLAGAMQAMGYPKDHFRILFAQQVTLLENGEPVVMSKRTGKFITMDTLCEEIPVDVSRYFFAMRAFESHLDFDMTEAKDISDKNPYYYVAYAHARIRSIFAKAAERNLFPIKPDQWKRDQRKDLLVFAERRRLLWLVARFPDEVRDAAEQLEPHRMIAFLYQLAGALSKFYLPKENRVIDQNEETAGMLLSILDAVAVSIKNGLALLGMNAPERMTRDETT